MKRKLLLVGTLFLLLSSATVYAEKVFEDYDVNPIQLENATVEGTTEGLIVYSILKENSSSYAYTKLYGVRDISGDIDTGAVFSSVSPFSEGLAAVYQYDEWGALKLGYIDKKCKLVIPPKFDSADPHVGNYFSSFTAYNPDTSAQFVNGRALIKNNGKYAYIDKSGKIVIKTDWSEAYQFSDGLAKVGVKISKQYSSTVLYGYIDTNGKTVIKPQYEWAHNYSDGIALVRGKLYDPGNSSYQAIDKKGKRVFDIPMQQVMYSSSGFSDGLMLVKRNDGKYGYINTKGKVVIDYKFVQADNFAGGLARVSMMKDGEQASGFINTKGEVVIKPNDYRIDSEDNFKDGYQIIHNAKMADGVMDSKGNILIEPIFGQVYYLDNNKWVVFYSKGQFLNPEYVLGYVEVK